MELTGKAKKDFEKWLWDPIDSNNDINIVLSTIKYGFEEFPFSMKYGVYVDWGDSVDMEVFINYSRADMFRFDIFHNFISLGDGNLFKTRPEAQTAAVKKANEIYNEKHT